MAAPSLSELFDIGVDILASYVSEKLSTILLQTGDAVAGEKNADNVELYQQNGFWSRPAKATPGVAGCQGVVIKRGGHDACIAQRDLRTNDIYGNLKEGESCVGATTGPLATKPLTWARTLYKADGSVCHFTSDANGNTILNRLTPIEWRLFAPWGSQLHDSSGYHLRTWHGAKIDGGGLGLPAPFNIFGSYWTFAADIITLDAAMLVLGRDSGAASPVALATPLLIYIAALQAALNAQLALNEALYAALAGLAVSNPGILTGVALAAVFTPLSGVVSTAASATATASVLPVVINARTMVN